MNKKSPLWVGVLAGLLMVFFIASSCKTPRKAIVQPLKEQGPEYLFQQMKKNELKFSTLSAKFSAEAVVDNNNTSFTGIIYVKRDSVIWLAVSKFGIEVARFLITPDSAKMINRMNDTYFMGDFDYVCKLFKLDFDFDMLQSIIIGNDLSYYDNDVFKTSIDNRNYKLSTIGRRKLKKYVVRANEDQRILIQDLWLDPTTFKIVKISMKEVNQENRKFDSYYSDFDLVGDQKFPFTVSCEINDTKKIRVDISYSRVILDQAEMMGFKIPAGFKRVN